MDLNAFAWANTEAKLANKDLLVSTWNKKSKDGEKIIFHYLIMKYNPLNLIQFFKSSLLYVLFVNRRILPRLLLSVVKPLPEKENVRIHQIVPKMGLLIS